MIRFGNFVAYIIGIRKVDENAKTLRETLSNPKKNFTAYGLIIIDDKRGVAVGGNVTGSTRDFSPLHFSSFEEARNALFYIVDFYQMATGDMTVEVFHEKDADLEEGDEDEEPYRRSEVYAVSDELPF